MQKEMISMRQAISMIVSFLFGSTAVMGMASGAGHDSWIALIVASLFGGVIVLVYARLIRLLPGMDFYDMAQAVFGKIIGKIIIALMVWYAIQLSALVLRSFSEFIQIVSLMETPQLVVMVAMLLVTSYMAFSGIETLAKWVMIALALILGIVLFTMLISIRQADISNIFPILEHDFSTMGKATLILFAFPFAETVIFLTLADSIKKSDNAYKIYLSGIFIGGVVLLMLFLRNVLILDVPMLNEVYFPSYAAARVSSIGEIFSRIEMSIFANFILGCIAKLSICILAAVKGVKKLFSIKNNGRTLFFVSFLILLVGKIQFDNVMEMVNFSEVYPYYAMPFQIAIPILVWIGAEIKMRKKSRK
jgi:spore germination protein KB